VDKVRLLDLTDSAKKIRLLLMSIIKNRIFFLPVFILIILINVGFSQSFEDLYKRGLKLFQESNYNEAEICLRESLKYGIKKDIIHFLIGMCSVHQCRLKEAENHFLVSLEVNSNFEECYLELGGIYFKEKEYVKAEHMIIEAIKINPENKYARDFLGTLYYINGLTTLALDEWNKISKPILGKIFVENDKSANRELLVRELSFNYGQIIKPSMIKESQKRLSKIGNISNVSFNIFPHKQSHDEFDLQISFFNEKGLGRNASYFLINLLRDITQKTLHLDYKNISNANINAYFAYRFSDFRKKTHFTMTFPRFSKLPFYFSLNYKGRSEIWSLNYLLPDQIDEETWIKSREFSLRFDYIHNDKISYNQYLKFKIRKAENDLYSVGRKKDTISDSAEDIFLYGGEFIFDIINNMPRNIYSCFSLAYDISSQEKGMNSNFVKLLLTLESIRSWKENLSETVISKLLWRLKLGYSTSRIPIEEKFILGIGPDTHHYLRAHSSTYGGKLGGSPIVDKFILSNLEYSHRLVKLFPFEIKGGVFIDCTRIFRDDFINHKNKFIIDVGVFSRISLFKFPFILSYGYNFKENINSFYVSSNLNF